MFAPHIEGSQLPYETELFVSSICVEFPVQPVVDVNVQVLLQHINIPG